jgi:O-methyltransferase
MNPSLGRCCECRITPPGERVPACIAPTIDICLRFAAVADYRMASALTTAQLCLSRLPPDPWPPPLWAVAQHHWRVAQMHTWFLHSNVRPSNRAGCAKFWPVTSSKPNPRNELFDDTFLCVQELGAKRRELGMEFFPTVRSILARAVHSILKDLSVSTGVFNGMFSVYSYMFTPQQLFAMTELMKDAARAPGCFVEVGCAYGATTVFLNKFMDAERIERSYHAIDTFSGFVNEHINHEIEHRGKNRSLRSYFKDNRKAWFDTTMAMHRIERVNSVSTDVTQFDFRSIAPIAFCLLDVDLYLPIRDVLPKIYAAMSPGGIIVVDDCSQSRLWDGALQAYEEFVKEKRLPIEIVSDKLGVVRVGDIEASTSLSPADGVHISAHNGGVAVGG